MLCLLEADCLISLYFRKPFLLKYQFSGASKIGKAYWSFALFVLFFNNFIFSQVEDSSYYYHDKREFKKNIDFLNRRITENKYKKDGFYNAKVNINTIPDTIGGNNVKMLLNIDKGDKIKIKEIFFMIIKYFIVDFILLSKNLWIFTL